MVIVASDGFSKSFPIDKDDEYPPAVKRTADWFAHEATTDVLNLRSESFEEFLFTCTQSGSGDDTSIAIAYCRDKIASQKLEDEEEIADERTEKGMQEVSNQESQMNPQDSTDKTPEAKKEEDSEIPEDANTEPRNFQRIKGRGRRKVDNISKVELMKITIL